MIHVIDVKNPFDVREKVDTYVPCTGQPVSSYHIPAGGVYHYAINGKPVEADCVPVDGDEIVIMPYVGKKVFGWILSIGLTIALGMITGGAGFAAGWSIGVRIGVGLAVSVLGGMLTNKLTPVPKVDLSNTEQSNTYGWGGAQTLSGQGYVLPVLYGKMKTGGIVLQRHVVSNGEKQYLNVLYALAEGVIDSITDIKLNGNPIENYNNVVIEKRYGTNDQDVIENFNDSYADTPLTYELTPESGWHTHTLQGNTAQGIEATLSFPQGLFYSNDDGGTSSTWVKVWIQYKKTTDTTWTDLYRGEIKEKTNAAFFRTYRIDDLEAGQYDVRAQCESKAGSSIRYANKVEWISVTQIIYDDFKHPGKALLGLKALATDQLSGSDPQMTCVIERRNVYVWKPSTSEYVEKPANNPAWAAYDILHQCRDLDGTKVVFGADKSRMDYYAFEAWATMCDETELTFNYLYDTPMKTWDALVYPSRIGRGCVLMVGTRITCVYDFASQPVQLFSVANVKKESFTEEFLEMSNRANAVEVAFVNKDKDYERDVLTVFNDEYDTEEAVINPTQIELMGCVTAQQAYRYARWKLRENKYEIRTISFEAFVDAIACKIGDVVLVQTDVTLWGNGGRIEKVSGGYVYLDTPIEDDFTTIMVRDQETDEIYTADILTVDSTDKTKITVSSTDGMSENAVYTVGKTGNEPKKVKILAIEKSHSEETRIISAIEYYDELYETDTSVVPTLPSYDNTIAPPKDLTLSWEVYSSSNGNVRYLVHCSWINPITPNPIKLEYSKNNEPWILVKELLSGSNTYSFDAEPNVSYNVRVYAENAIGRRSVASYALIDMREAYSPAITPTDITIFTRYRQLKDGVPRYDLVVQWMPEGLRAHIYYKTNNVQSKEMVVQSGVPINEIGFSTAWTYSGEGVNEIVIPQAVVGDTYRIAICPADNRGVYVRPDDAVSRDYKVQPKTTAPNVPDGFTITFGSESVVSWSEVANTDIAYYEVRLDNLPGVENANLLARVTGLTATLPLSSRIGTLYLFAFSASGKYSAPAILNYNKVAPAKPNAPTLTAKLGGFSLVADSIPTGCNGMNIYVDKAGVDVAQIHSLNNVYTFTCDAGVYDVEIAYTDLFGEGTHSNTSTVTVKVTVDSALLDAGAVTKAKLETAIQDAVDIAAAQPTINQNVSTSLQTNATNIAAVVTNLNDSTLAGQNYSAILVMQNGIASKVAMNDVTSYLQQDHTGFYIKGSLINIDGDTVINAAASNAIVNAIQANSINGDKIVASSIAAGKLNVSSLSAISATIGLLRTADSGARMEIESNQLRVYDTNGTLRVRLGVWQ